MNVLIIGNPFFPRIGGVGTVMYSVNKELARMGHNCIVLTEKNKGTHQYELCHGMKIIRYPKIKYFYGLNPFIYEYLCNILRSCHIDIVHVHGYHSLLSLECAFILRKFNIPFVFSPHYHGKGHTLLNQILFKLYHPLGAIIFHQTKKIVCVSEYEKQIINNDLSLSNDKITVIPNGVEKINAYLHDKKLKDRDAMKLLFVGRLDRYKGVQYIFEAMYRLKKMQQDKFTLTIVGTGSYCEELKTLARKLNLMNDIIWYDMVANYQLRELYRTHDVLLLLSQAEAFGLVVAEALAQGLPCIVAKTAALTEFINEPGCFGISYPIDVGELTNLLINIINAEKIVVGPFSKKIQTWPQIAKYYENLYLITNKN
jgi:glycosyltransferase involved in cell wall biosynthesis